jgi:hypothetical protein
MCIKMNPIFDYFTMTQDPKAQAVLDSCYVAVITNLQRRWKSRPERCRKCGQKGRTESRLCWECYNSHYFEPC